jgi:hypothetical protein
MADAIALEHVGHDLRACHFWHFCSPPNGNGEIRSDAFWHRYLFAALYRSARHAPLFLAKSWPS